MNDEEEVKIVIRWCPGSPWSGMLMARFSDGSFVPIKTDKHGYIYVKRYENE